MIEIIPAIDIIDGQCVRLRQGNFSEKTIYSDDPSEVAKRFEEIGIRRLHIVDLDGARTGSITNLGGLRAITKSTDLSIDFGGGIRSDDDIRAVFDAGADYVSIGSVAVKQPQTIERWIEMFGGNEIMLGADVRGKEIYIDGWRSKASINLMTFIKKYRELGIEKVFVTDISRDGLLAGPAIKLYQEIVEQVDGISLIASGGVSDINDIFALDEIGCSGVIVGKAIYEGKITFDQIEEFVKRDAC